MKEGDAERKVAELGGFLPRSEPCGEPYDGGTWVFDGFAVGRWVSRPATCTKPKGHGPEEQFDPPSYVYMSEGPVHGRRNEGAHARNCPCGCHDAESQSDCERCWPVHLPFDGCLTCAEGIKSVGENPTDGHWYLMLIFKGDRPHEHFAASDMDDLRKVKFSLGGRDG